MNRVNGWLLLGDANDGRDWQKLLADGITAVVNITQESDGWPEAAKEKITYLRLNQADGVAVPFETFDAFAAWIALRPRRQFQLLVHCGAGISRTGLFGALALMLVNQADWTTALTLMRASRPQIAPNPVLVASLIAWWIYRSGRPEALIGAHAMSLA